MDTMRLMKSWVLPLVLGLGLAPARGFSDEPPTLEGPLAPAPSTGSDTDTRREDSPSPSAPAAESNVPRQEEAAPRPASEPDPIPPPETASEPPAEGPADAQPLRHEVFLDPSEKRTAPRVDRGPPEPINERPGDRPTNTSAQWVEGYWDWDAAAKDFVWVTGTWRVSPPDSFWVSGYWRRDDKGWFRVPGFWSRRQTSRVGWRQTGPPANRPDEPIAPAPGPDYFYVPGQFVPEGEAVVWKPGFWSRAQAGWEWVPANWIHLATGWSFRQGFWKPAPNTPNGLGTAPTAITSTASERSAVADENGPDAAAPAVPPRTLDSQVAVGTGPTGVYMRGYNAPLGVPGPMNNSNVAAANGTPADDGAGLAGPPSPLAASRLYAPAPLFPPPAYYGLRPGYYAPAGYGYPGYGYPGRGGIGSVVNGILRRVRP